MAVTEILNDVDMPFEKVILGEVHLKRPLKVREMEVLREKLKEIGFELIDTKGSGIIEKIKQLVIQKARNEVSEDVARMKLSTYIADSLHHEYTYLSNLFSSVENRTIENYFIEQRIEYVKELLVYGELTLSEIADKLDYSSTAHISAQFKKVTGLTPSHYKKIGAEKRRSIDEV
jgi:AraC-like DNA-binding protein